jgi:Tfp pilus assembly protein PilE
MGQQQLLLIVLSVIIVGIAVVVGINMFNDQAASSNLDAVTADLVNLASRAQQHFRRPTAMGGGGGSFALLTNNAAGLAYLTTQPTNDNGTYSISTAGNATSVTLQGVGVEDGDGDGVNCTARIQVWADSVALSVISR